MVAASAGDGRASAIRRYLETGESDLTHPEWPGSVFERCGNAKRDLVNALISEVRRRSQGREPPASVPAIDLAGLVRVPGAREGRSARASHRLGDLRDAGQLHNNKRRAVGLPETRTREWLLDIEFRKRETFAYACEAYSRILELAKRPAERRVLLAELEHAPADDRVEEGEYRDILEEAVAARNGWKRILARCSAR